MNTGISSRKPEHMFVKGEPVCIQKMWDTINETKEASKKFGEVVVITGAKVEELCKQKIRPAFVPQKIESKLTDKKLKTFRRFDTIFSESYKDPSKYHIMLELCLGAIKELDSYTESYVEGTKVNNLLKKWQLRRQLIADKHPL